MRICIYGAGAVGGHFAARLANSGVDVSVVARGEHLAAIRANGLVLNAGGQSIVARVRASDQPADLGVHDVVIVTLKATGLPAFATQVSPLLGPDTAVVFAQNGLPWWYPLRATRPAQRTPPLASLDPQGVIAGAIPVARVLGGVIFSSNDVTRPGVIENDSPAANALVVGEPDDSQSGRVTQLRAVLEQAGISSPAAPDIRAVIWTKLLTNLSASSLCLLCEQPVAVFARNAAVRAVFERLKAEGKAIARAYGVDLDAPASGMSPVVARPLPNHRPSILVDYERGRPMEVEAIIMAPLLLARAAGVAAPTLEVIAALAGERASSRGLYTLSPDITEEGKSIF